MPDDITDIRDSKYAISIFVLHLETIQVNGFDVFETSALNTTVMLSLDVRLHTSTSERCVNIMCLKCVSSEGYKGLVIFL